MEAITVDVPTGIKLERGDSDDDNELMIDDEELEDEIVDEMNIEDPTDDTNDDQVRLEKLLKDYGKQSPFCMFGN